MHIFNDRWFVGGPATIPDEDGKTVFISLKSFGPLEIWEWGLDADDKPYELYKWIENDFYEDSNYCKNITVDELLEILYGHISLLEKNNYHSTALRYKDVVEKVKSIKIE